MPQFHTLFIEKHLEGHPRVTHILQKIKYHQLCYINNYESYFNHVRKPYLKKRTHLNFFIAEKRGKKVKLAPEQYGVTGDPHYYYIHFYNCIYECHYCYLQGYFSSPDLVMFINYEDILDEMDQILLQHPQKKVWFHGGEFSDSLALSSLTEDLSIFYHFFKTRPSALWELRTKSINTKSLIEQEPLDNLYVSFSLSPVNLNFMLESGTPKTILRIQAMRQLHSLGFKIAVHLDPIIYTPDFEEEYRNLINMLKENNLLSQLAYISLGVVRFTKDVFDEVRKNYPHSLLLKQPLITPPDGKIRYPRVMRLEIMKWIQGILEESGVEKHRIYFCMEN